MCIIPGCLWTKSTHRDSHGTQQLQGNYLHISNLSLGIEGNGQRRLSANSALLDGGFASLQTTHFPLGFPLPTLIYFFSMCYQTLSFLTSPQVYELFDSIFVYHISRASFTTSYFLLCDPCYFFHTHCLGCFLFPLPCCCKRKQTLMKKWQNLFLQQLDDLLQALLSYRLGQKTGEVSHSRSRKPLKGRYRPVILQEVIYISICTNIYGHPN